MKFFDFGTASLRRLLNATYAFDTEPNAWVIGIHRALAPVLDLGQGTILGLVAVRANGLQVEHLSCRSNVISPEQTVQWLNSAAADLLRESIFANSAFGSCEDCGVEPDPGARMRSARLPCGRQVNCLCVNGGTDSGLLLIAPAREPSTWPLKASGIIRQLGHHVGTGLRLQRIVTNAAIDAPAVEATPDEASRPWERLSAVSQQNPLDRLRHAFVARAVTCDGALVEGSTVWDAIITGRWSLVDRFESAGRSFVVAHQNAAGMVDPRRLTPREKRVTELAALGRSNKEIAFELEIRQSTAGNLLAGALLKLGVDSRTLLPAFWGNVHGRAWSLNGARGGLIALTGDQNPEVWATLTAAQRGVAKAVIAGVSDTDIAQARSCSPRTVAKHVAAVYRKLAVHSRAELACKLSARPGPDAE